MEIKDTIAFIKRAHVNQFDKGGVEYWKHPVAVMNNLPEGSSENLKHAALLHDVLEDTEYTKKDLTKLGYNNKIIKIVEMVTRPEKRPPHGPSYSRWIWGIAHGGNYEAIVLKMTDMKHNMDLDRINKLPEDQKKIYLEMRETRYKHALDELEIGLYLLKEKLSIQSRWEVKNSNAHKLP